MPSAASTVRSWSPDHVSICSMSRAGPWVRAHPVLLEAMRQRSGGRCECCGHLFDGTTYQCFDHDHRTGDFRGVICHGCNLAIGFLEGSARKTDRSMLEMTAAIHGYLGLPTYPRANFRRVSSAVRGDHSAIALIAQELASSPTPMRPISIAARISLRPQIVRARLNDMIHAGSVERVSYGLYRARP